MVVYLTSNETFPIPTTYEASSRWWHTMQAARQRRTSFSTIFLILKRGEFGRIKRTGPLSPILSLLVPGDFYRGNSATRRTINQLGSKLVGHILWWDTRYFLGLHLELVAAARSAYRVLPSYWTFIKMIKAKKLLFVSLADSTVNF